MPSPLPTWALTLSAGLALGLGACGDSPDPEFDAGLFPGDAAPGTALDGSTSPDAAVDPVDAGSRDSGGENDATAQADAGLEEDAGTEGDCEGLADGSSEQRTRYAAARVDADSVCEAEVQTRSCEDGELSEWSGTASEPTCEARAAYDCEGTPSGYPQARVRYVAQSVAYGESCVVEQQQRVCRDGVWGEWSGTAMYSDCEPQQIRHCEGGEHGTERTRTAFAQANAPALEGCLEEEQSSECVDGTWTDWDGSYQEESCSLIDCTGDTLERHVYTAADVAYGEDCADVRILQTRTCTGTTWTDWPSDVTVYDACAVEPGADCAEVDHGESDTRTRFSASSLAYGLSCDDVAQLQTNTCENGAMLGWTGDDTAYPHATCTVEPPAACGAVAHGQQDTRVCYPAAVIAYGLDCAATAQTQTCTCDDGSCDDWSADCVAITCSNEAPADCGDIAHGESDTATLYESASVPAGDVCNGQEQTRTCDNGNLSDWDGAYTHEACSVEVRFWGSCGDPDQCQETTSDQADPFGDCEAAFMTRSAEPCSREDVLATCRQVGPGNLEDIVFLYHPDALELFGPGCVSGDGFTRTWTVY